MISVKTDIKAIERADKRLAKYAGRDLWKRAERVYVEAAKLGIPHVRRETPVGRTGNLRRSVAASKVRLRPGEMAAASVGPRPGRKGGHRHLITDGHRIVTRSGRDTGERTTPNPFVDRALTQYEERALSFIRDRVLDIGGVSAFVSGSEATFSPF